jgi:hypothetical protein
MPSLAPRPVPEATGSRADAIGPARLLQTVGNTPLIDTRTRSLLNRHSRCTTATALSDTGERYGSTGMWAAVSLKVPASSQEPA